jgi:hypothetical protein
MDGDAASPRGVSEMMSGPASAMGAPTPRAGWRSRLIREPLLHFLVAGAALFALNRALHPEASSRSAKQIVLTQDDVRQMRIQWLAQGMPPPTPEQLRSLIEAKVREEVLYREALALGLDRDDMIVKRRMVQKMDFLAQDVSKAREPTSAELRQWFSENSSRFAEPPRFSFRHLYFSFDKRGQSARDDAASALPRLGRSKDASTRIVKLGDPFMFQDEYAERTPDLIAKDFGPAFARALQQLEPGSWQGPIESGYGWHLVLVTAATPGRTPDFEEVEPEVKSEWITDQGQLAKRRAYEAMRAHYDVVVTEPAESLARGR